MRQGIKLEEKAETAVTMITTVTNSENRGQHPDKESQRGNKGNRKYQQDGRYGGNRNQPTGRTITECGFCNLIKEKDVPQEYVRKEFGEIHRGIPDKPIRPNQCLPWIMLSIEDRTKVLKDSKVFCKFCLRFQGIGATSSSCRLEKHKLH